MLEQSGVESRILQSLPRFSCLGSGVPRADNPTSVFFCCDFQHKTCKHQKDHFGSPRGECNGFSAFVPSAGLTCGFSHVNRNSLRVSPVHP